MTSQLRGLIQKHNLLATEAQKLTWEAVTDLASHSTSAVYSSHPAVPVSVKKEACQALLMMERAQEEIVTVREEMNNTVQHYILEHQDLSQAIQCNPGITPFHKGSLTLLHLARYWCERKLIDLK